jgi:putative lipoprotein
MMHRALSLLLAVNLVYAQAAATRESWFGSDKIKHFFMSAFIESIAFSGLQVVGANRRTAFAGGIGAAAAFGLGREFHDRGTPGKWFSYRDLTWDALGAAAGAVLLRHTTR